MPGRRILTGRQRKALLDLPPGERAMLRHYTLADDDLEYIQTRRRAHNRFGFACSSAHCVSRGACLLQAN